MRKVVTDEIIEKETKLLRILPHGSGINRDWQFEFKKDMCHAKNVYDYMNETGYYEFAFRFTVTFKPNAMYIKFNNLDNKERKFIQEDGLRDYLEEIFYQVYPKVKEVLYK